MCIQIVTLVVFAASTAYSSQCILSVTLTPGTSALPYVNPVTAGRPVEGFQNSIADSLLHALGRQISQDITGAFLVADRQV